MKYEVVGSVAEVGTDMVLQLSKKQAAAREGSLEKVKGGHRPKRVLQFKKGEKFGISSDFEDLPRSLSDVLKEVGTAKKELSKDDEPEKDDENSGGEGDGSGDDENGDGDDTGPEDGDQVTT